MAKQDLLLRISVDPQVCHGQACIRGTRIMVSVILDCLAAGMPDEDILREYPGLEAADVLGCIAYGAEMSRQRFVGIALEN